MIRLQASAILAVRDGYSGRPVSASAVQCFLDGQRYLPQYRQGGYLVFLNLESGSHQLLMRGAYYQDEYLEIKVDGARPAEYSVTLKPSAAYPFRRAVTRLTVHLEGGSAAEGQIVWVAPRSAAAELRLSQDEAAAGSCSLKLFYRGGAEGRFPGNYLVCDKTKSEAVLLERLEGEQGTLKSPLAHPHKRGAVLLPAQAYRGDGKGRLQIFFREPVPVCLFQPGSSRLYDVELSDGSQEIALTTARKKE